MKTTSHEAWSDFPALDLVRTTRSVRLFGRITLLLLIGAVLAALFVPWRQTATGTGTVVALDPQERPQPVKSATKGIVDWVKPGLREGSYVEQGETVMELKPAAEGGVQQVDLQIAAVTAKIAATQARIDFANQQVEMQRLSGDAKSLKLDEDLTQARKKMEQTRREYEASMAELRDKENLFRVALDVAEKGVGIIPRAELVSKEQAWRMQSEKAMKAELAVEEALAALEGKTREIESEREEIKIKNTAADAKVKDEEGKLESAKKELSELEVKKQELARLKITVPRSGFIQQWNGLERSDTVKEGDQVFIIVPDAEELCVEMTISGNDIPLVHEGDKVRLQFEGWPAVQSVGWPSVAIGTFGGKVNRVFPTDDGKGNFRILVTPDNHFEREDGWPDKQYLRQGVRANGWVLLRRVPLGYEIWRQFNGFPPSLIEAPKKEKLPKVKLPKA